MTLDEWLTLTRTTNAAAAESLNRILRKAPQRGEAEAPPVNEDRMSRLRLGRRRPTAAEIVAVRTLTGGQVTDADWLRPPAEKAKRGNWRMMKRGIWIVHVQGVPDTSTASLSPEDAWRKAGHDPAKAPDLKKRGIDCRMVSEVTRRQAFAPPGYHDPAA